MWNLAFGIADSVMQLKRARKEGRLAEAMLDRRSKLKRCVVTLWLSASNADGCSDRFC